MRAELTKRLIREQGFTRGRRRGRLARRLPRQPLRARRGRRPRRRARRSRGFQRFPPWMWRNADVLDFVGWLRDAQRRARAERSARSASTVSTSTACTRRSRPSLALPRRASIPTRPRRARARYALLRPLRRGRRRPTATRPRSASRSRCERGVVAPAASSCSASAPATTLRARRPASPRTSSSSPSRTRASSQNAEEYYRTMFRGRVVVLEPARPPHGRHARRARSRTSTARRRPAEGRRLGAQLAPRRRARDRDGPSAASSTSASSCASATRATCVLHRLHAPTPARSPRRRTGAAPAERKRVRRALPGSYEALFHARAAPRTSCCARCRARRRPRRAARAAARARDRRHLPARDRARRATTSTRSCADQFDAVIHIDETRAVEPLERTPTWERGELPETYPTAL